MKQLQRSACILFALLAIGSAITEAQKDRMVIDATAPVEPVTAVQAALGSSRDPAGHTIQVNSRFMMRDGKPWLPVMGELHYSRVPEAEWENAILRMKAGGVDIISSYVIWIHHEQNRGSFEWSGNKDLRHFAQLCAKHGMYFYPRIGPWAHAEVRNGGLPDWVLAQGPTRENDPQYLEEVTTFYNQIGRQLQGLYWKDGGPIVGIQIENEYRLTGPGRGSEHIRTLKKMAIEAGMDVPLYTVTGWDGAAVPFDAALPVFGGYPDAPWDSSPSAVAPPEIYSFRFDNRSAGSMGAIGGSGQGPASTYRGTPFLTAEIGAGIQDTYFRRPVVSADDIASIAPVMLGSGANMLGYYMFHGGRNPDGGSITLQESQRTGYPTDVPVISYDFQAPISNNGEERESYRRLKLVHYFVNDFGALLAPMTVRRPMQTPDGPSDLSLPRIAARTLGNSGFVFVNNYTRNGLMPKRPGFQVELKLPGGSINIPQQPITLPAGAYGIWPVNLDLDGVRVRYSTAQLMNRVERGRDQWVFFFAIPGVVPEFLLETPESRIQAKGFQTTKLSSGLRLRATAERGEILLRLGDHSLHIILLPRNEAEDLWKLDDPHALLMTHADVLSDSGNITLQQAGNPNFQFALFGAQPSTKVQSLNMNGMFAKYRASVPPVELGIDVQQISQAGKRPPLQQGPKATWRTQSIPMAPEDADFASAGRWKLSLHGDTRAPQLADVLIRLRYDGDVARLRQSDRLLDDNFWNGVPWIMGIREVGINPSVPLTLQILPLSKSAPMYLQNRSELAKAGTDGQIDDLQSAQVLPRYIWMVSD